MEFSTWALMIQERWSILVMATCPLTLHLYWQPPTTRGVVIPLASWWTSHSLSEGNHETRYVLVSWLIWLMWKQSLTGKKKDIEYRTSTCLLHQDEQTDMLYRIHIRFGPCVFYDSKSGSPILHRLDWIKQGLFRITKTNKRLTRFKRVRKLSR